MILVKVIDGVVIKFPYTMNDLQIENPSVSFPEEPSDMILNEYNVYRVFYHPFPEYDNRTHRIAIANEPSLHDGVWCMNHSIIEKEPEEIELYDESELAALRGKILTAVDLKTNDLITYGFVHFGNKIRLTLEDQHNYEGEYSMIKDFISLGYPEAAIFPVTFKVWTNEDGSPAFYVMNNLAEMRHLISAGKMYIKDCLTAGWYIKNSIPDMTLTQLKAWVDPRA
jgi:hypothetical protein